MTRQVTILGSTGSVGQATLDLLRRAPEGQYSVTALTAHSNLDALCAQAREFRPRFVAIGDERLHGALKAALAGTGIETGAGAKALCEAAAEAEAVEAVARVDESGRRRHRYRATTMGTGRSWRQSPWRGCWKRWW